MSKNYDKSLSMILIGNTSVGKTCLTKRYTENVFSENLLTTVGVELFKKIIEIDKLKYEIKIWDSCGQERLHSITFNYYKNADGILLVYDLSDHDTFSTLQRWLDSINEICDIDIPVVIVGNKMDLERKVEKSEIDAFYSKTKIKMFECSCKTGEKTTEPFDELIRKIIVYKIDHGVEGFNLNKNKILKLSNEDKKKCC